MTVTNLCLEAGVGRDSFYRSDPAFLAKFSAAKAKRDQQQPELVALRGEIRDLKQQLVKLRAERSEQLRDLERTIHVYANQIQALTLHSEQLRQDNERLRHQLTESGSNVVGHGNVSPGDSEHPRCRHTGPGV